MHFLVDEDLSPDLVGEILALGHHADDAKTQPVAFQAACYRMRIIRLMRPKSGKFPAAAQGRMLAAQLDAISAEIEDPDGARMMNLRRDGGLDLVSRDDVVGRLRGWDLEAWPEAGAIG